MLTNRPAWLALLVVALAGLGCSDQSADTGAAPLPSPTVADNAPPPETEPTPPPTPAAIAAAPAPEVAPAAKSELPGNVFQPVPTSAPAAAPVEPTSKEPGQVRLDAVKYDELLRRIAANDAKPKFTIVDAWATWCGPCKENFPHLVEMHHKYGDKGLAVVSLSFDDPTDPKLIADANAFLKEKKAVFANFVLDEDEGVGFEKLNINAIPAVFLYGPDGKELKRFTMDDPNNQFTYDQVDQTVAALLAGKPLAEAEAVGLAK